MIDAEDIKGPKILSSVSLPADIFKGNAVGDKCRIEISGEIVNIGKENVSVEVHKSKYIGKAGKVSKDEYTSMKDADREKYDREQMDEDDEDDDESDSGA